ncbi:MAG TPA: response regulator [Bryobacteraceae bacterium]|nr:response regulator [Bryobacteraceae bacterium]
MRPDANKNHHAPPTVLIVDNDRSLRTLLRISLERSGFTVLEAENGERAKIIADQSPSIHLLLTDIAMPAIRGPELAVLLSLRHPAIKVLYMSASRLENLLSLPYLFEREFGFIQKPFTPDALAMWIRAILQPEPAKPPGREILGSGQSRDAA